MVTICIFLAAEDPSFAVIPPTEAPNAHVYGIIAGVVTSFVLLIIFTFDVMSFVLNTSQYTPKYKFKRKLRRKKNKLII